MKRTGNNRYCRVVGWTLLVASVFLSVRDGHCSTIVGSNGTWTTSVVGTGIIITYTPNPSKITCSKIYLSQSTTRIDQNGNLVQPKDFKGGVFDFKQDDTITAGASIDHVKCEKDPYYNGEDSGKDTRSQGSSDGVSVTSTSISDRPYYSDQSFPDNVTSITSTFEVCPICVDTGQPIDSVKWTYSRTKGSQDAGTTTDAVGLSVSQEFRNAFNQFMATHGNGTSCPDKGLSLIPTLSEWKRIFLTLLMMSLVMGYIRSQPPGLAAVSCGGLQVVPGVCMAFDKRLYWSVLKWTGLVVVSGLSAITAIFGPVSSLDIAGTLCCAPLVAYIVHLAIPGGDAEESVAWNR